LDEKLIYLAGMFDADGSVSLLMRKQGMIRLRVQATNTDRALMDWLLANFGGSVTEFQPRNENWKRRYDWRLQGDKACELLTRLAPHLIIKQERAALAIEAWHQRHPVERKDRRRGVSDLVIALREYYVSRVVKLNQKGATMSTIAKGS
jgi:hypothetical protein